MKHFKNTVSYFSTDLLHMQGVIAAHTQIFEELRCSKGIREATKPSQMGNTSHAGGKSA